MHQLSRTQYVFHSKGVERVLNDIAIVEVKRQHSLLTLDTILQGSVDHRSDKYESLYV